MSAAKPAAVGGFILGGLAIVVAGILFFGGTEAFSPKTKAVVYFSGSVGGLGPGSPVTFRGVRVGSVSSVAVVIDPGIMAARIPVHLKLEPDRVTLASGSTGQTTLLRLIEAGLTAKLEPESLVTGQMLVDLDFGPGAPAHTVATADSDMPEIPSVPSDWQELRQQLTRAPFAEAVLQTKQTMAAIERVAGHLDTVISPLAGGAQNVFDKTGRTMDVATAAIHDLQQSATTTLDSVQGLATDGRQQLAARGQELSRVLAAAEKTVQVTRELMASADSLVVRGSRSRDDLDATLRDLAASASTLRDLLQATDRDPSIVLRGRGGR